MPPSSRKRNKGKERKAKQHAKKEETERSDANRFWLSSLHNTSRCVHGHFGVILSEDHPVSSFMDQFIINSQYKSMNVNQNLYDTFKSHINIWNNESYRSIAISIFIRIGANILLQEESVTNMNWPFIIAQAILVLEHYNGTGDICSIIGKQGVASKWRDINTYGSSGTRDCLKFFRKRTSCKCLKKMHLEARKTTPKMGMCWNCKEEKERASIEVCRRCMVQQYCSKECQIKDWARHKKYCDYYVLQAS